MRVKFLQESSVSKQAALLLEVKVHELESQCGLEEASRVRAEVTYQFLSLIFEFCSYKLRFLENVSLEINAAIAWP
jgi:hypothetical protein